MGRYEELDPQRVHRYKASERVSKVFKDFLGKPPGKWNDLKEFAERLPKVLKANDLKELVEDIVRAKKENKEIILTMGAHPIKCGLSPIIIDLMEEGFITAIASNGASVIHDVELALWGATSEEVDSAIKDGSFGMASDTADFINEAIRCGKVEGLGFGESVGKMLIETNPQNIGLSVLAAAYRFGVPFTVHIAIGSDIIHMHPTFDGSAAGELSTRDFRIFAARVARLDGGVILNFGSTVVMPEVFLKAISMARNLGYNVFKFTAANFDMIQHYRPNRNIVERPTSCGGKGFTFTGHHEIMLPLLAALIKAYS
ncbi:MAG: hypothetical protein ACPL6C_00790 [bacterium]